MTWGRLMLPHHSWCEVLLLLGEKKHELWPSFPSHLYCTCTAWRSVWGICSSICVTLQKVIQGHSIEPFEFEFLPWEWQKNWKGLCEFRFQCFLHSWQLCSVLTFCCLKHRLLQDLTLHYTLPSGKSFSQLRHVLNTPITSWHSISAWCPALINSY